MGTNDEILWEAPPHTLAKIKIVENYLKAWTAILSHNNPLLIIDGFAGPGRYKGGEEGSPIASIKVVLEHSLEFKHPVKFIFIEKVSKLNKYLEQEVDKLGEQITNSDRILGYPRIILGECEKELGNLIDEYTSSRKSFGPAFVFLDQFGYSKVSMKLISRIMEYNKCEVFVLLNWNRLNQFMEDEKNWSSITNAFGTDQWRDVFNQKDKGKFMLNLYTNSLRLRTNSEFVWHFSMKDKNDKLIYWLFFCTNSIKGLEKMKEAMCKVDHSGGFCYSDRRNPDQLELLSSYDEHILFRDLVDRFGLEVNTIKEIKRFILVDTPLYKYAKIFQKWRKNGRIVTPQNPESKKVRFQKENLQIKFNNR